MMDICVTVLICAENRLASVQSDQTNTERNKRRRLSRGFSSPRAACERLVLCLLECVFCLVLQV